VPIGDRNRIAELEERLARARADGFAHAEPGTAIAELELLADLYMQADSYLPALETIQRLLALPAARTLSPDRKVALESRAVGCRLAQGDPLGALAHCRELLAVEENITSAALRSRIHMQCAEALFRLGRIEDALPEATAALAQADTVGDHGLAARALHHLGRICFRKGDLAGARDYYEQALGLYRRLKDEWRAAMARVDLALILKNQCEWDAAVAHLQAALDTFRGLGRFPSAADALLNLGIVYQKSGEWERAGDCYGQAEQIYQQIANPLRLTMVRIARGNVARLQRRFDDAEALFAEALRLARELDASREEVLAIEFLGEMDADRDRDSDALARYDQALMLASGIGAEGDLVVELERRRADSLARLGRLDEAERACRRAQTVAERIGDHLELALAHRAAAAIAWARGQRDEAKAGWADAVRRLTGMRERYELARTLFALGRAETDAREGRRHLYRASALFAELSAQEWLARTDRELQRLLGSAGLDDVVTAAARTDRRGRAPQLFAYSNAMQRVDALARRAAATDLSVLVTGETGTGKEIVARTIHALSSRAARPFLAVNCGALRVELALSQLFGHRKGAFTGAHADAAGLVEAADGGTLCLDEVGELPLDVQVTLLRFLESGEYMRLGETRVRRADVRIIAATNRELRGGEGERLFRRDLLFRLNEIEIRVPPLRERRDDIVPLARHFLAFYGGLHGPRLSADAEAVLPSHRWPGNVRELENVMKRAGALHAGGETLDATALLPLLAPSCDETGATGAAPARGPESERAAILSAYERSAGNKSRLAVLLGVSRKTLYARLKRLDLRLP
jgi:DNA-binding NtrC family response regulator/Tfp pilus assembly protein PilF